MTKATATNKAVAPADPTAGTTTPTAAITAPTDPLASDPAVLPPDPELEQFFDRAAVVGQHGGNSTFASRAAARTKGA